MSDASSENDRKAAQALGESTWGNNRREGNVPLCFDVAFAAHRIEATAALSAELDRLRALTKESDDRDCHAYVKLTEDQLAKVSDDTYKQPVDMVAATVAAELLRLRAAAQEDLSQQKKWAEALEQIGRGECPGYSNGYIWRVWRRVRVLGYLVLRMQREPPTLGG